MSWPTQVNSGRIVIPIVVYPFTSATVTTETSVLPYAELGFVYQRLIFKMRNASAKSVYLYVYQSENGTNEDVTRQEILVPTGQEGTLIVDPVVSLYYAAKAETIDASSVSISVQLTAEVRH